MAAFHEGDDKWQKALREMGIDNPPVTGEAAQWSHHLKFFSNELESARKRWSECEHHTEEAWEEIALPLYQTWLGNHWTECKLENRIRHTRYIKRLRTQFKARTHEEAEKLKTHIQRALNQLSSILGQKEEKLRFDPALGGSVWEGTKIGPMDEWDYRAHLKVKKDDPVLKKLYPLLWESLEELKRIHSSSRSSTRPLRLVGFWIHSARLPGLVFSWPHIETKIVKVDLTPTVEGGPWTGVRANDPFGNPIPMQHYILLHGSHGNLPTYEQPVPKPTSCVIEQDTTGKLPPIVKEALILLKIITNLVVIPQFHHSVPKTCRLSSYNLKDAVYWALSKNKFDKLFGDEEYQDTDDISLLLTVAQGILSELHDEYYFAIQPKKGRKTHLALKRIYFTLLTGKSYVELSRELESAPIPGTLPDYHIQYQRYAASVPLSIPSEGFDLRRVKVEPDLSMDFSLTTMLPLQHLRPEFKEEREQQYVLQLEHKCVDSLNELKITKDQLSRKDDQLNRKDEQNQRLERENQELREMMKTLQIQQSEFF